MVYTSAARYPWIAACVVLVLVNASCIKTSPDFNARQDQITTSSDGYITISPGTEESVSDRSVPVKVSRNLIPPYSRLVMHQLILRLGDSIVPGSIIPTDSTLEFVPDKKFNSYSTYTVSFTATLNRYSNQYKAGIQQKEEISESWDFSTKDLSTYRMTETSRWITNSNRDGAKVVQVGDYMYLYGGWTAEPLQSYSDVFRSSGDLSVWERLEDAPWKGRHTFGLGWINKELFVFGGDVISDTFDVWKTNDGTDFQVVATELEETLGNRILYGACTHQNKLFVLGGQSSLDLNAGMKDVFSSNNGHNWKKIASNKEFLGKNLSGSVVSFDDKLWVFGGGYYKHPDESLRWTNEVYSSPDGITWNREPDGPWAGRSYADVCVWDGRVWMVGGENGTNLRDIWWMNKFGEWTPFVVPDEYEARHATAVGVYNDKLVIACGNYHNDCWVIEKTP